MYYLKMNLHSLRSVVGPLLLCALFVTLSCQGRGGGSSSSGQDNEAIEAEEDTVEQATTIIWVDKGSRELEVGVAIRTAKAKVFIHSAGKIDLKSFVKEQPLSVRRYLKHRLDVYRIPKLILDSGFVKPGEQYVQLRYFLKESERF